MELYGWLCAAIALNVIVFAPIGSILGHTLKGRWRDGAGLGFLLGPFGLMLIPTLEDERE